MDKEQCVYTAWQHEREMTRLETQCKRWFAAFLVVLIMLFGSNLAWIIYENSFQDVYVEQVADGSGGGDATIYSGTGDVNIGESKTDHPDSR